MTQSIVEGAKALDATLRGVKESVRKRIMRNSVNRALTIIAREIRKSVPAATTPGHNMNRRVKKSVGIRRFKAKLDKYAGKTGLRVGTSQNARIAPHAHWIPLGTRQRQTRTGANRGSVKPRPFVAQAASAAEGQAVSEMSITFRKSVEREIVKQRAKNRGLG